MPFDEDPDHERPLPEGILPPEDRLWRHPSELGGGGRGGRGLPAPPPLGADHPAGPSPHNGRRHPAVTALAGACLAGALVSFGAMWLARPMRVVERSASVRRPPATAPSSFAVGIAPTRRLAGDLSPSLALLQIERDGRWTTASAVWTDGHGTLAAAAPALVGASRLVVTGTDGVRRTARLAGLDPSTAVAVLVVDRTAGTPVRPSPQVVDAGVAAALAGAPGTAAGEDTGDATVAAVTVRAVSLRATVDGFVVHDAIQLDREIPADAVGGALVDADGRLLGLAVGNSTERGLGAVIPAASLFPVVADLRERGAVERAWLGVQAVDLDPAEAFALQLDGGARLTEVTAGSPAELAGLRIDDIVTEVDQDSVDDASDLVVRLGEQRPGDRVRIGVHRGDAHLGLDVVLSG